MTVELDVDHEFAICIAMVAISKFDPCLQNVSACVALNFDITSAKSVALEHVFVVLISFYGDTN